ncbi:integral membrane protein [Campylobacter jejuni subsp. doylei]|nr:integral membrane protein [Campylobacter jejuni subsp. doylei]
MINKNKLFRQVHIYLSLFFLPCALLFALTGIVYIFGIKQDVGSKVEQYQLSKVIESGKEREALIEYLKTNGLKVPSNTNIIKSKDKGITIGGIHYSANITQKSTNEYNITLKTRSLLGDMIMLHFIRIDKAAWYFSVLSVGFGITLFMLYISGLMITLFANKKDRSKQFAVLGVGVVVTLLLAYLSL